MFATEEREMKKIDLKQRGCIIEGPGGFKITVEEVATMVCMI